MMKTNKIKAILFDFDGVIAQTETYKIHKELEYFNKLGLPVTLKQLYSLAGGNASMREQKYDEAFAKFPNYKDLKGRMLEFRASPFPIEELVTKHIKELLTWLKSEGYKTAVCSNSRYERLDKDLKRCNVYQYIDFIGAAHDLGALKPDPYVYKYAMKQLDVESNECLIVEDSMLGIHAGKLANCTVIALQDADNCIDQREADYIIKDLLDLKKLLQ